MTQPQTPGEATPEPEATADASVCPKCGSKLVNPEGLGWCAKCGFCRTLQEDSAKADLVAKPAAPRPKSSSALGITEFFELLARLPRWFWILLAGIAAIIGASVALDRSIPALE